MKIIKCLSDMIAEEIADADKYITKALKEQYKDRALADTFASLSAQEMEHMRTLHGQVERLIHEYRAEHGEPPEGMKVLYDILHEQHIASAAAVIAKQNLYAGNP